MSTTLKAAKTALFQYYYSVVPNGRGRFYYSRRVSKIVILNENGYYLLLKVHSLGLLSVSVLVAFHTNWMFISVWEKFKWNFIFYFEKLKVHVQNLHSYFKIAFEKSSTQYIVKKIHNQMNKKPQFEKWHFEKHSIEKEFLMPPKQSLCSWVLFWEFLFKLLSITANIDPLTCWHWGFFLWFYELPFSLMHCLKKPCEKNAAPAELFL